MSVEIERFETSAGARIYRWPLDLFPDLKGYAHLVLIDGMRILIDAGSGFADSNPMLEAGLEEIKREFGEPAGWQDLSHVLITHGHIDHFGGLPFVLERSNVSVGVHELDLRILTNYEERLAIVARRLRDFLDESGVTREERHRLMALYLLNKQLFSSVPVDFTYESVGMQLGRLRMTHVPGHCPGHVVILVDDILLCGDHVLSRISPHQSPERLSLYTGLGHYFESLERLRSLAPQVRLALGGHYAPIEDLSGRIDAIEEVHRGRLSAVLDMLQRPCTAAEIAHGLFPSASGYHELLAFQEAGAHIEYLLQRGYLGIENYAELEGDGPVTLRYIRREGDLPTIPPRIGRTEVRRAPSVG
jgi:glyoxylase-like metal-dependent hydrolase (beta-lactamase superfamily II)